MAGSAILTTTCPHCAAQNSAFTSVAQVLVRRDPNGRSLWNVFFACNGCFGGLVASIWSSGWNGPEGLPDNVVIPGESRDGSGHTTRFGIHKLYPSPPSHSAPSHVPDRIAAAYIEASENLHRQKFETSQMLCRKALDLATKRLLPESQKTLYKRIEELKESGKITPEMAAWAHVVRDDGNGSVHDEDEATKEGAAELLAFTETFLMYAFTLPGMIQARRNDVEPEAPASN